VHRELMTKVTDFESTNATMRAHAQLPRSCRVTSSPSSPSMPRGRRHREQRSRSRGALYGASSRRSASLGTAREIGAGESCQATTTRERWLQEPAHAALSRLESRRNEHPSTVNSHHATVTDERISSPSTAPGSAPGHDGKGSTCRFDAGRASHHHASAMGVVVRRGPSGGAA
jgi:hypothetical protein